MAVQRIGIGAAFYDAVNVKYQGAVGDGVMDDTAAIQASLDLAFGSSASPHGTNTYLNKTVYFPAGQYKITAPLLLTNVKSGIIRGEGKQVSTIVYGGGSFPGNSVTGADNTITPIFMMNGFAYSSIESLGFSMPNSTTACIYLFGNPYTSSPIYIHDCMFQTATIGILAGLNSLGNVSEVLYSKCVFTQCAKYGFRISGANTLNHNFLSCSFSSNGNGGLGTNSAAISMASGSIPTIVGCDFAGNLVDVIGAGANTINIIGCRTESPTFLQPGGGVIIIATGCAVGSGTTYFSDWNSNSGTLIMDGCDPINSVLSSTTSANLYIRGGLARPLAAGFFTSFSGKIWEYDLRAVGATVAQLPTAATIWKGVRLFVIDSNITASGNYAVNISGHGGGTNTVPLWCDGTSWLIG